MRNRVRAAVTAVLGDGRAYERTCVYFGLGRAVLYCYSVVRTILTSRKRGPGARSTALKQHGGACRGHTVSGDPDDAAATGKLSITHCDAGNSAGDGDVGRRDWRVREETRRKFCCCVDGISKRNDLLPGLPPPPSLVFPAVHVHAPR